MTPAYLRVSLTLGCLILTSASAAFGQTYNVSIPPKEGEAYQAAHYRLWLPPGIKQVKGVIVRQHGCGEGARKFGLEHADDPQWQALAKKWDCALLGSQLWAPMEDCSTWTIPDDGSARAFLSALDTLAEQSKHAELEHAPWFLWGHSGGAMWACNMTYRYPNRVAAGFPRSGSLSPTQRTYARSQPAQPHAQPAAFQVPTLFCYGEKEADEGNRFNAGVGGVKRMYAVGVKAKALWAVAVHPGSEHENSNSRQLAVRWFDALIPRRLPDQWDGASPPTLKPIQYADGWLGDLKTFAVSPAADRPADAENETAWLPDESTAHAWREFVTTGAVADHTPPPAPRSVSTSVVDGKVQVAWQADADLESGLAEFRIFRDGVLLGKVAGKVVPRWNPQGHYHAWNYSDQPMFDAGLGPMQFADPSSDSTVEAVYSVTTVNPFGLESPATKATP